MPQLPSSEVGSGANRFAFFQPLAVRSSLCRRENSISATFWTPSSSTNTSWLRSATKRPDSRGSRGVSITLWNRSTLEGIHTLGHNHIQYLLPEDLNTYRMQNRFSHRHADCRPGTCSHLQVYITYFGIYVKVAFKQNIAILVTLAIANWGYTFSIIKTIT